MFDASAVAVKNGRYFGFPYSPEEAKILVIPAPWDVTTSYRDGASLGPAAILAASTQLDFFSPYRPRAWETAIGTAKIPARWEEWNREARIPAKAVLAALEAGSAPCSEAIRKVNETSAKFHGELESFVEEALLSGQSVVTLGGDHSISFGPLRAHGKKFPRLSVLHIDAHADLRDAYAGFPHSHASIMRQVAHMPFVDSLVQIGLRDVAPEEMREAEENPKIHPFFDWDIRRATARGLPWMEQCKRFLEPLGRDVYLSLDVDGLDPKYCPHTGTPVPGGLELWEFFTLLEELERSGRRLVGADLVEVAPSEGSTKGEDEWDANVGARLLFQICQFVANGAELDQGRPRA